MRYELYRNEKRKSEKKKQSNSKIIAIAGALIIFATGWAIAIEENHKTVAASTKKVLQAKQIKSSSARPVKQEKISYYNIALSKELQAFTYRECKRQGVNHELMLAVMRHESGFKTSAINTKNRNKTIDYGLCQINSSNLPKLKQLFGLKYGIMNPYNNIRCGVYMLKSYRNDNLHKQLTSYNRGVGGMMKLASRGITRTKYSNSVLENLKFIKSRRIS